MKTIDEKMYLDWKNKNSDPYGGACFIFAETWADAMEPLIATGKQVKDIASDDSLSKQADEKAGGITGFMYGMVISILAKCWIHGEELRKWHNGEYNQPDAKGVVNPALMTIE